MFFLLRKNLSRIGELTIKENFCRDAVVSVRYPYVTIIQYNHTINGRHKVGKGDTTKFTRQERAPQAFTQTLKEFFLRKKLPFPYLKGPFYQAPNKVSPVPALTESFLY